MKRGNCHQHNLSAIRERRASPLIFSTTDFCKATSRSERVIMDYSHVCSNLPSSLSPVPPQPLSPFSPHDQRIFPSSRFHQSTSTFPEINMATETAAIPVNGTYTAVHTHGYEQSLVNHSANVAPSTTPQAAGSKDIPKDQVAWYFVEQYYTTMSRNPEKLPVRHTFPAIGNR